MPNTNGANQSQLVADVGALRDNLDCLWRLAQTLREGDTRNELERIHQSMVQQCLMLANGEIDGQIVQN
jgi:hypothetical protein